MSSGSSGSFYKSRTFVTSRKFPVSSWS